MDLIVFSNLLFGIILIVKIVNDALAIHSLERKIGELKDQQIMERNHRIEGDADNRVDFKKLLSHLGLELVDYGRRIMEIESKSKK